MLSARSSTTNLSSSTDSGILPNLEYKLNQTSRGRSKSSVLKDGLQFIAYGAQAIAQDEFSKCFTQKPRSTIITYLLKGLRAPFSFAGLLYRYFVLFPMRLAYLLGASVAFFSALPIVLYLKNERLRRLLFRLYCKAFLNSWGARIRKHGAKPKLNKPHIFVSNHTSFIDYLILSADTYPHATVAQRHGGLIGYFQKHILALNGSLVFERAEKNQRTVLAKKMRDHVHQPSRSPLLIFPEGTCVNNEYTVLFHKGAFDLGADVAPVAIKYDKSKADAYWHTKTQTFTLHLLYLMTRWELVADVWYLPPRAKKAGQSAVEFANEVKAEISQVAKLKNLHWDGYWKNFIPAAEKQEKLKDDPRNRYAAILMKRSAAKTKRGCGSRRRLSLSFDETRGAEDYAYTGGDDQDWNSLSTESRTSLRNQVLVSLQDQERKDLSTVIKEKRNDIVYTWISAAKRKRTTMTGSLHELDSRRLENISWRLWFKENLERSLALASADSDALYCSNILEIVTSLLPFPSSRVFSPQDLYSLDLESIDTPSPASPSSKRLVWNY